MLFLLILIISYLRAITAQDCSYDINRFEEITCFNMTSAEQIRDVIAAIMTQHNSLPRLIEFLELDQWKLSQFSIPSLKHFLPELKQIRTYNSNIKRLTYEKEDNDFYRNTTFAQTSDADNANGTNGQFNSSY